VRGDRGDLGCHAISGVPRRNRCEHDQR
jgi:hypothetical protein